MWPTSKQTKNKRKSGSSRSEPHHRLSLNTEPLADFGAPHFVTLAHILPISSLGIVASNTRDNNTGATYPHLNFSIPITVLQQALQRYSRDGNLGGLRELDRAPEPVKVVWRLQRPLAEAPRSKL